MCRQREAKLGRMRVSPVRKSRDLTPSAPLHITSQQQLSNGTGVPEADGAAVISRFLLLCSVTNYNTGPSFGTVRAIANMPTCCEQITRYLQDRIEEIGDRLKSELPFPESPRTIGSLLATVLPPDDSAFQFSTPGGGFTSNPEKTLGSLYQRYVEYYTARTSYPSRTDDEVWKVFRKPLEEQHVIQLLKPKRVVAPDYEYEFERARKNEVWHTYEPVSCDLMEATSIVDKANTWVGRITSLAQSEEKFKPYFLLGEPRETNLHVAFIKAQNILHRMPCNHEFIREAEAEDFAKHLKVEVEKHGE